MSSGDDDGWGFAPPPFQPEEALQGLRRQWRALGLTARAGVFARRGLAIARAAVDGPAAAATGGLGQDVMGVQRGGVWGLHAAL